MKTTATLKIEFMCGDNIKGSFTEAIRLATILDVYVEFEFNTTTCVASPNSSVSKGVAEYHLSLKKNKNKMAFS